MIALLTVIYVAFTLFLVILGDATITEKAVVLLVMGVVLVLALVHYKAYTEQKHNKKESEDN